MNAVEDIKTRTFGLEIEMCNFDKSKVVLPAGFEYSREEQIYNTDGIYDSRFGGEVNTPPLRYCEESFELVKSVYDNLNAAGGKMKWCIDLHVHLFAGDLELEHLKRLIMFQYATYPYLREYVHMPEWDEINIHSKPLITEKEYINIKAADSLNALKNILTNQSQKGFVRHVINVASFFVRNTVEFRCFHATQNVALMRNCVEATYRMFYFAINHTEEDFWAICSYDEFVKTIDLPKETPPTLIPLIYQGNPYSAKEAYKTLPILYSSKLGSVLLDALQTCKAQEVAIVNSFMFQYELNLWERLKVKSYNQDGYSHLLYLLAKGEVRVHYTNKLEWLEKHNSDDPVRQVAVALYIFRIMKFVGDSYEFQQIQLDACKSKAEESLASTESSAKRLIKMLGSIEYVNGNLHDAISANKTVFFSFGAYKRSRRALRVITDNSDYENMVEVKNNDYYELIETMPEDVRFFMFSNSPYLSNMFKVAVFRNAGENRDGAGKFLYCNKDIVVNKADMSYFKPDSPLEIIEPPDDLVITDHTKLSVCQISGDNLYQLQKRYIKKVDKIMHCKFAYAIMYDKYCLGAVGFDFPRTEDFSLWQVSDFCTNNNVPRLSKLILLCILSKDLQKMLSRRLNREIKSVISYAYTDAPVSMKYRGVFKKEKKFCTPHKLAYYGIMGKHTLEECLIRYNEYRANAKQ